MTRPWHPQHCRPGNALGASHPHPERPNFEALVACQGPHDFALVRERGNGASRAQYRCALCGGTMAENAVRSYFGAARHIFAAMDRGDIEALRRLKAQVSAPDLGRRT